jgi:uncharacterized protein YbjT (DUF2867 family)
MSDDPRESGASTGSSGEDRMSSTILVVGGTGSIGRRVVARSLEAGHRTRVLVRDRLRARRLLPPSAELVRGRATEVADAAAALEGVDAVVLTHGSRLGPEEAEAVDYGIVRSVVTAALSRDRPVRLVLMTASGVTVPEEPLTRAADGSGRGHVHTHRWKRRAERLLRRSGLPCTIVRPGGFDRQEADAHGLRFLQGDPLLSGVLAEGAVSRDQIARVLLAAATSDEALGRTFSLVAARGPAKEDLDPLFAALAPDVSGASDGVRDPGTLPFAAEPHRVLADLAAVSRERVR